MFWRTFSTLGTFEFSFKIYGWHLISRKKSAWNTIFGFQHDDDDLLNRTNESHIFHFPTLLFNFQKWAKNNQVFLAEMWLLLWGISKKVSFLMNTFDLFLKETVKYGSLRKKWKLLYKLWLSTFYNTALTSVVGTN